MVSARHNFTGTELVMTAIWSVKLSATAVWNAMRLSGRKSMRRKARANM